MRKRYGYSKSFNNQTHMKYIKNLNESKNRILKDFWENISLDSLLKRGMQDDSKVLEIVKDIERNILKSWDEYSKMLTNKFDWAELESFKVNYSEFQWIEEMISDELKDAIVLAKENIEKFHKRQIPQDLEPEETSIWVFCSKKFRWIEDVWLYIPWWTAPLFSTLLMLWIPALLAWCKNIYICTPPQKDGSIAPEVLYTAQLIWIKNIFKIGGAQAIFSFAYGTNEIPRVDKIFWPWNSFVTAAKMLVSSKVAIDMPAWPSEVLVISDSKANSVFVAADLLSQAEHGPDSQVVLISDSEEKITEVLSELDTQLEKIERKEVCKKSLENSVAICTEDIDEAIRVSNIYAPEHLLLQVEEPSKYISKILNAWSVFLGKYSCESAWDYASGTNHTLPTNWYAKSYSWVSVESFGKWITFQELNKEWIKNIWKAVEIMSKAEWLQAHNYAMKVRRGSL